MEDNLKVWQGQNTVLKQSLMNEITNHKKMLPPNENYNLLVKISKLKG